MNLEDFNALSNNDQLITVLGVGVYMSSYTEENYIIDMYQLEDFFIKVITDSYKLENTRIITFTDISSEE